MGSSIGISIIATMSVRNSEIVRSYMVEAVRPDNPVIAFGAPALDFDNLSSTARFSAEISRQALMVSYVSAFHFFMFAVLAALPLVLLIRMPRKGSASLPAPLTE
jgi:DHA2 family multidrug resistance protein